MTLTNKQIPLASRPDGKASVSNFNLHEVPVPVSEHMDVRPEAPREPGDLVASGRLEYRESVAHGIEAAPEAFPGLLEGRNFGKRLVHGSDGA
jgi:NADPH-dependent curcumin reductase CurA